MKKIIVLLMFTILLSGCNINESIDKADKDLELQNMFVTISNKPLYPTIIYHKDTKVMYAVSKDGVLTVLVDTNGQPLIYNKN